MKRCYKCGENKDLLEFSKDRSTSDGMNAKCKLCVKDHRLAYEVKNEESIRKKKADFYVKNKEKVNKRNALWKKKNPSYQNEYSKKRRATDPIFKLKDSLRQRLNKAIERGYKKGSAVRDLGCDIVFLKFYLESKFKEGMSWNNHGRGSGKWNIDHIIPLNSFDLTKETEVKKACHYTNLQPLWSEENLSKGTKI